MDILKAYWETIGGKPVRTDKKRGRLTAGGSKSETPDPKAKKAKTEKVEKSVEKNGRKSNGKGKDPPKFDNEWEPPEPKKDSWEDLVLSIETIEHDASNGKLFCYLKWTLENEDQTKRHSRCLLDTCAVACPQALIKFFTSHLCVPDFCEW
jgi:hypothetical protein